MSDDEKMRQEVEDAPVEAGAATKDDKGDKDDNRTERKKDRKDREKDKDRKKDRKDRYRSVSRSRSRDRRRRSRSRDDRNRRRSRSRSRSRDRRRRARSSSRDRRRRSRSASRDKRSRRDRDHSSDSDGVGGYKPRKKLPEAPPQVAIGPGTGADPFAALRQIPSTSVDPSEITRMWHEQQLKARQLVLQQQAASAAQAASKTQREIYVGNLMAGAITDATIMQVFNTALMVRFPGSNIPGMEPVIKVNMHSSGKYAFVEFRTPEMATAALDLNGQVQFMGQAMSVNRPSGYVDPGKAAVAAAAATHALSAFQQGGYTGIQTAVGAGIGLIPGMPGALPMVGGTVGALQSAAVAQSVATAMGTGGMALPGPPPIMAAPAAAALAGTLPTPVMSPTSGSMSAVPTTCVCVIGMVTASVLKDDAEYKEIIEDLKEECGRHGAVVQVKVPRPSPPHLADSMFGTGDYGKAFVRFADLQSATAAKNAIHGRMFAGSTVHALFITDTAFALLPA
ncbi:hypothetical protein CEUSTIGMA_g7706.t1 [Chlamydomonas eustigma]|uniref:RRM domain-containing protein n=1 Tax=Chlamydomonas eustigma TaxID=1157962 RepID=A0A250XB01_9CHLO|nr:hypothetical protein CEUSTIGMA_g7706.t1 [Chlamydomonas eustigma]|eukprot:GAX80268.1 hypothetical protein CEUSTIGMA_g7706.t1 [Chlamydomonas eustigma]